MSHMMDSSLQMFDIVSNRVGIFSIFTGDPSQALDSFDEILHRRLIQRA